MNKKPLANCPGCKLLVKKLEDDYHIKIKPNEIPTLINSVAKEESDLRKKLSDSRNKYTLLDAQMNKQTILLTLEVNNAELELEKLLLELKDQISKQNS